MALTIIYILDSTRFEMVLCSLYNFIEIEKTPEISTWEITILLRGGYGYGVERHFQQYFSHIGVVSFIGGGNRSITEENHRHPSGFELTTLMVIGTGCIGSLKSNYHTITTTTAPISLGMLHGAWL